MSTANEAMAHLHENGWNIGDTAFAGPTGRTWLVYCQKGDAVIRAEAPSHDSAWEKAARMFADGEVG